MGHTAQQGTTQARFDAWKHPVLAVDCPTCGATPGQWCKRPSAHRASDFHRDRKTRADEVFIRQHGKDAMIKRLKNGTWKISSQGRAKALARQKDGHSS